MIPDKRRHELNQGKIYIVSTPIGNMEDITLRALKVLQEVGLIAAESREHTRKLCAYYTIKTPITTYNSHNQHYKGRILLEKVKSGLDIALVSDAGTPGLSDPGSRLVREAIDNHIRLVPIPGVSASLAALSVSGLPTNKFIFVGFLSNKKGRRRKELEGLKREVRTMIFFESPHRLIKMLTDMYEILGNRDIVLAKEMTKSFEEVKKGSVSKILSSLEDKRVRGEYTIIVEGAKARSPSIIDN
ncbi:MAG: 16S rRNA (cytidine(1402)-2'-O)-methyltransferase [Deltaproteobacteria bacterium]|nr:16S rRNA (cytidine(1402)-2'-O)-methyltransferase [Deltaproteobacteria bacterium]RLB16308.1 MAG: 16S rRNA (cytidine(1402)-2'-O)-methyltransferase [Deltaproteobacteria bacterium]RLB22680.1 MAG: 16S rRNA (cytidine(1402)-2'-O)-methyltransferase [Deltaproteobacteria bacterium]HDH87179.1 16S rRNA (cytidine(1402)-2'-O)-methyltransferase [Desulfobacteraceae bacterium]